MPVATTPTNAASSWGLRTRRSRIISGRLSATTAIMNARRVPIGRPFSYKACTIGMIPAALEYSGTPMATATRTPKALPAPASVVKKAAVTRQPNRLNSMPMAISLTSGLAIRKLNVTPIGTPAATNPMNAGTALHEQNGVITPRPAAITLPDALALASEQGPSALDAHVGAQHRDEEDDPDQQQCDLDGVVEEEMDRLGEPVGRGHPQRVVEEPVPQPAVDPVRGHPCARAGSQGKPLATRGGRQPFGDAHHLASPAVAGRAACSRSSAFSARV